MNYWIGLKCRVIVYNKFYWCYDGSFHLFYRNLYTYFNCPMYKKNYMIFMFQICHKMFHRLNCQNLWSNDNMFCKLLQPLGLVVYNMVMCLCSNLSALKITCSLKSFLKGWSFFGLNPCKMFLKSMQWSMFYST
jgi:hypothetical protein